MKTITVCSSANFYREVITVKQQLETMGYRVLVPKIALTMQKYNNYDVTAYKTWFDNADDYDKKTELMRTHFDKVAEGDAVLVVNNEKHGVADYIGGNVLMEMAIAMHLHKPIFLLNGIPAESSFLEEIIGLGSVPLQGDLQKLSATFPPA